MATTKKKPRARRGNVGVEIFEQIEKLVGDQKLSRTKAFEHYAQKTGRNAGTVAANYYRIARLRGTALRSRTPRRGGRLQSQTRGGGTAGGRVQAILKELAAVLQAQEAEIERLRRENMRFEAIRKLVARS